MRNALYRFWKATPEKSFYILWIIRATLHQSSFHTSGSVWAHPVFFICRPSSIGRRFVFEHSANPHLINQKSSNEFQPRKDFLVMNEQGSWWTVHPDCETACAEHVFRSGAAHRCPPLASIPAYYSRLVMALISIKKSLSSSVSVPFDLLSV